MEGEGHDRVSREHELPDPLAPRAATKLPTVPYAVFDEELDRCSALQERLKPARRLEEARVMLDRSGVGATSESAVSGQRTIEIGELDPDHQSLAAHRDHAARGVPLHHRPHS